jgi:hypothetical protein
MIKDLRVPDSCCLWFPLNCDRIMLRLFLTQSKDDVGRNDAVL